MTPAPRARAIVHLGGLLLGVAGVLGAYALLTLRDNQVKLDALMAGPVRQAELAADLNSAIWAAHAKLYRLAATAANETDSNKIQAMAREASAASSKILDAVKALEAFQTDDSSKSPTLQKLHAAATSYLKQAKNAKPESINFTSLTPTGCWVSPPSVAACMNVTNFC